MNAGAPLRIVFFGTPALAVPTLARLCEGPHEVVCVVSQPDRRSGRGRKTQPSPVSAFALEHGIPLLRPEKVGTAEVAAELAAFEPDVGVVVAYGQFIAKRIRELPSRGFLLNGHASLLPKLRGAAPIARAILDGETRTGISVMRVEKEMDAGPVALVRELAIGNDETTAELELRMGELAAEALAEALDRVADGSLRWTEQDHAAATEAPKLERREAALDWSEPAAKLVLRIRTFAPKPGGETTLGDEPLRVIAAHAEPATSRFAPGTVHYGDAGELRIATADGDLVPTRLQRAGGKPLATPDFLRGRPIPAGTRLSPPDAPSGPNGG